MKKKSTVVFTATPVVKQKHTLTTACENVEIHSDKVDENRQILKVAVEKKTSYAGQLDLIATHIAPVLCERATKKNPKTKYYAYVTKEGGIGFTNKLDADGNVVANRETSSECKFIVMWLKRDYLDYFDLYVNPKVQNKGTRNKTERNLNNVPFGKMTPAEKIRFIAEKSQEDFIKKHFKITKIK